MRQHDALKQIEMLFKKIGMVLQILHYVFVVHAAFLCWFMAALLWGGMAGVRRAIPPQNGRAIIPHFIAP
jgi:hypothetical protein